MRTFKGKNCQFCFTEYRGRYLNGFMLQYSKEKKLNIFEKVWKKYIDGDYKPLIWIDTNLGFFEEADYNKYLKFVQASEKQKVVMVEEMIKSWERLEDYRRSQEMDLESAVKFIS